MRRPLLGPSSWLVGLPAGLRRGLRPAAAFEILVVLAAVLGLEALGRRTPDDASDVLGMGALAGLLLLLAFGARSGFAPITAACLRLIGRGLGVALRRLSPVSGVAFRLPSTVSILADRLRLLQALGLVLVAGFVLLLGSRTLDTLRWLEREIAYTPYLALLGLVWLLFGFVVHQGLRAGRRLPLPDGLAARLPPSARLPGALLLWLGAVFALAALPAFVSLLGVPVVALGAGRRMFRNPGGTLHLWRRDRRGDVRAASAATHLRASYGLVVAFLFFTVALAQGPRLVDPDVLRGPFALTQGLGLAATAASLLLIGVVGLGAGRQLDPAGGNPGRTLVRTLWWPGVEALPTWAVSAQSEGWRIARGRKPPPRGLDLLVVPGSDDPRRLTLPDDTLSVEDSRFRLERRFHVVNRRAVRRGFRRLLRDLAGRPQAPGQGCLFAPHLWAMPQVVRDTGLEESSGVDLGGSPVGRPYAALFPPRVRRYLGMALRALDVDLVYWEDGLRRGDLERVLGVLFETWDQERSPLVERHFVGLPRVRVVIQEPEDVDGLLEPAAGEVLPPGPLPLRARILVVRRDDTGAGRETPVRAPGSRRPSPAPVLV